MTYPFLDWPVEVGRALRFFAGSGTGVSRGLAEGFALGALLPKTVLIARSVGTVPLTTFSTLRRFAVGLPLAGDAVVIPRPTVGGVSVGGAATFRLLVL